MLSTIKNILLLGIIVWTLAFTGIVQELTQFALDFNSLVIVFIPQELMVVVYTFVFIVLVKTYQAFKS